jgi:Uma2 family endonuclease
MDVAALVSAEEYLNTSYSPDREYVDGCIVAREVGERPHSRVQANLIRFLDRRYPNVFTWPEQRVRTLPRRWRIPDVCVTLDSTESDVFEEPPLLCVEILSCNDRMSDVLEKLEEYRTSGVEHIWLIDPWRRKGFTYTDCLQEVKGAELSAGEINLPLSEVFDRI